MICMDCGAEKTMRKVVDPATGERDIRWVCARCDGDQVPPHPGPLPQEEREKKTEKDDRYFVRALADGLGILLLFVNDFHYRPATLDEITKTSGLHKAKVYRIVKTLQYCGFLEDLTGEYALNSSLLPNISRTYTVFLEREMARVERMKRKFVKGI